MFHTNRAQAPCNRYTPLILGRRAARNDLVTSVGYATMQGRADALPADAGPA